MTGYLVRRMVLIVPTLLLVSIIVFGIVRMIPGTVVDLMASEIGSESGLSQEETVARIKTSLGLDVPVYKQYGQWIAGAFQGQLGTELWTHRPVSQELVRKIPVSFELGIMALLISLVVALPVGIYSAVRQDTIGDYLGRSLSIFALSVPNFWVATMVIVFPSIWWNWTPSIKYIPFSVDPMGNLLQFIIPAAIMGMNMSGSIMRMTRTMMLEVLRQDYVRTGWAKGLRERTIVLKHALRNALIPIVTQIGMRLPMLIAGAVIMEQIFDLPGVGRYLLTAIGQRDYPIISGVNLVLASFVLLMNLVVDISYSFLDPRVQYG